MRCLHEGPPFPDEVGALNTALLDQDLAKGKECQPGRGVHPNEGVLPELPLVTAYLPARLCRLGSSSRGCPGVSWVVPR